MDGGGDKWSENGLVECLCIVRKIDDERSMKFSWNRLC